ncbi:major urea transporter [Candida orthopsilosis Co 90-125]|uniref:Major urea transporter n=1 Tax=Candida orthopsilosis (strain 90-125) TaxID=1136231 RepID=H8X1H8_CANO9|nr:major urea transporter [Candida orthopsilosis Co 90-125]CCG22383.1 major urea transporter [Candida orthopsilosis Co 90-125]
MSDTSFVPLPQSAGYAILVGLGAVFAFGMILTTYLLKRYNKEIITAEEFATAGRSVKSGLISAAVVSSWTWAATLLTSTTQAYKNGIFGSCSYAFGATVQITLFASLAIKAKERAPSARTYLEIVRARYGTVTHIIYIFWGLATNILVTAMLLSGGSATVRDLTGMHPVAACLLIGLSPTVYSVFGGLKATILTDYAHTVIMVTIIIIFAFSTWATNHKLGSPGVVWDLVMKLADTKPVDGNHDGSFLTFNSKSGGIFFVINIVGNFGTVFLDNGYFNKAFAADPVSAYKGYILGSLAWLPIPAFCSLTLGFAALALEHTEYWPLGRPMTSDEVAAGLVLPNAASALLGKGGAVLSLIMIYMAVTSAMSSELIAVSTISTYDIYRTYINPNASGKKLIFISHISCAVFAYAMAGFAIGLYYANVSMGFLYELMGIIIGGAVLSSAMTILSAKQNWHAATFTPPIATGLAIMSWLVVCKTKFGTISYDNLFEDDSMLTGNVVALLFPLITVPLFTLIFKPQNFNWKLLETRITRVDEEEELMEATKSDNFNDDEKLSPIKSQISVIASQLVEEERPHYTEEQQTLHRAFKRCVAVCLFLTVSLLVIWPMPLYGSKYIFSRKFFTGWVVVFFIWIWYTVFQVIVYPVWEGRHSLYHTARGIYWDLTGQTYKLREWQNAHPEELHAVQSQVIAQLSNPQVVDGKAVEMNYGNIDDELSDEKK